MADVTSDVQISEPERDRLEEVKAILKRWVADAERGRYPLNGRRYLNVPKSATGLAGALIALDHYENGDITYRKLLQGIGDAYGRCEEAQPTSAAVMPTRGKK